MVQKQRSENEEAKDKDQIITKMMEEDGEEKIRPYGWRRRRTRRMRSSSVGRGVKEMVEMDEGNGISISPQ